MRLFLIGGFLGSGKTTAITTASKMLMSQGRKVAVVTNDQGEQLVDNSFVESFEIPTRAVSNGCFCCNYDQLDVHIQALNEENKPEFIFAESVGSCTDLVATIAKPLAKYRPEIDLVISVFADATVLRSVLDGHQPFQEDVMYIYHKQLEEADILVVNKVDLLSPDQLHNLKRSIKSQFPQKMLRFQNSTDETEVSEWLDEVIAFEAPSFRHSLEIDYDIYAAGEANLAWFDKSIEILSDGGKAIVVADKIIQGIHNAILGHALMIGHLKFFVESGQWKKKVSFTIGGRSTLADWEYRRSDQVSMLINARVQTDPNTLEALINEVLLTIESSGSCTIKESKWASFKPGYPTPVHRITDS